jgi:hypothetical protein
MRRRQFIAALAGVVAAAPALRLHPSFAEQAETVRHIGVLMGLSESDPASQIFVSTFVQELARLGWMDGRNARIEQRWGRKPHKCPRKGASSGAARRYPRLDYAGDGSTQA